MALTYLHRTPSTAATNTKKATLSWWTKVTGVLDSEQIVFFGNEASNSSSNHRVLFIRQNNIDQGGENLKNGFQVQFQNSSGADVSTTGCLWLTNFRLNDPTAWYHIVVAIDTAQATASNRLKVWINGNRITDTHGTYNYYPSQNLDFYLFNNQSGGGGPRTYVNYGKSGANGNLGAGQMQMAEVHAIDGSVYDETKFGEFSDSSGTWVPKSVESVSYGNNGFYLKFADASNIGLDSSGNSNNFTASGTVKKTVDTPNNNFATFDSTTLNGQSWGQEILNSGNSLQSTSTSNWETTPINLPLSKGKWYFEVKVVGSTTLAFVGLVDYVEYSKNAYNTSRYIGDASTTANRAIAYYTSSGGAGRVWTGAGGYTETNIAGFGDGDILMIAIDLDNNKFYSGKNGTWNASGDPTSGATGTGATSIAQNTASTNYHGKVLYSIAGAARVHSSGTGLVHFNFGNGRFGSTAVSSATNDASGFGTFEYTVPSGYYAICTKNVDLYG
tara:strand:- start:276 stop:1775 length:1500 start_codon:yes stop_codon:yes gene_type:complete